MARNIISILIALFIVGAVFYYFSARQAVAPEKEASVPIKAVFEDRVVYTADPKADKAALMDDCEKRGGRFNSCGSVCAPGAEACDSVCAFTCELKDSAEEDKFKNMKPSEFTAETAKLTAIDGSDSDGIATREFDGSAFIHTVTARLEDPAEGKFYEGWLVNPESAEFFSTGRLEKAGGGYALTYTSDTEQSGYYQVVVTEETLASGFDNVPEKHILEGKFEN